MSYGNSPLNAQWPFWWSCGISATNRGGHTGVCGGVAHPQNSKSYSCTPPWVLAHPQSIHIQILVNTNFAYNGISLSLKLDSQPLRCRVRHDYSNSATFLFGLEYIKNEDFTKNYWNFLRNFAISFITSDRTTECSKIKGINLWTSVFENFCTPPESSAHTLSTPPEKTSMSASDQN